MPEVGQRPTGKWATQPEIPIRVRTLALMQLLTRRVSRGVREPEGARFGGPVERAGDEGPPRGRSDGGPPRRPPNRVGNDRLRKGAPRPRQRRAAHSAIGEAPASPTLWSRSSASFGQRSQAPISEIGGRRLELGSATRLKRSSAPRDRRTYVVNKNKLPSRAPLVKCSNTRVSLKQKQNTTLSTRSITSHLRAPAASRKGTLGAAHVSVPVADSSASVILASTYFTDALRLRS